jgi:hypothetical protein
MSPERKRMILVKLASTRVEVERAILEEAPRVPTALFDARDRIDQTRNEIERIED